MASEMEDVSVIEQECSSCTIDTDTSGLADNDELFAAYAEQILYGSQDLQLYSADYAANVLDEANYAIYSELKAAIEKIAAGEETSTGVHISEDLTVSLFSWSYADLGLTAPTTIAEVNSMLYDQISPAMSQKFQDTIDIDLILECLIEDCPYELYWFDKTSGLSVSYAISAAPETSASSAPCQISNLYFTFAVASGYQDSSSESSSMAVDKEKVSAAKTAAAAAQSIVENHRNESDMEKLASYKDEICNLVSYNNDAAEDEDTTYGDPWELIYVFDNDTDTNVVCEGYSKAFQYLCELSEFDSDIACYTVDGQLEGATVSGFHMWNIVSIYSTVGQTNYLVDVTNSDTGTIGVNGGLFMVTESDASAYTEAAVYTFTIGGTNCTFTYDDNTKELFSAEILTLGTIGTDGDTEDPVDISGGTLTLSNTSYTFDGNAKTPSVTVKYGENTLTAGTDYTVSYSNNTNAGSAAVTITGIGNYTGTLSDTFTINKADQSLTASASASSVAVGDTADITVSGEQGTLSYSSDDTSVASVDASGVVTGVSAGTAVITVTAAATENYNQATVYVTITVTADPDSDSGDSGSGSGSDDSDSGSDGSGSGSDESGSGSDDSDSGSGDSDSGDTGSNPDSLCVRRGKTYYISYTIHEGNADSVVNYGRENDEVLIGDWDGDGLDTICVRRGKTFYFKNSLSDGDADIVVTYGRADDEILVGDWDGDGKDTLAVRRGSKYYIKNTISDGDADLVVAYGRSTDTVLVGDWDGDGKDTLTVRRGCTYYVKNSIAAGDADQVIIYGRDTDEVLVGDWDGDGIDTFAVRRGSVYYISNSIHSGNADNVVAYGRESDVVYAGKWQ